MYVCYPSHIYFPIAFLAEVFSTDILHIKKSVDKRMCVGFIGHILHDFRPLNVVPLEN